MRDLFDELLDEARRRQEREAGEPAHDDGEGGDGGDDGPPIERIPTLRRRPRGGGSGGVSRRTLVLLFALLFVVLFGASAIDLWTESIWFRSVGFEGVFYTRLWVSLGLFIGGFGLALGAFLGSLWLAARLAPPAGPARGGGGLRDFLDGLNRAAWESGSPRGGRGPRPVELPDITPIATVVLVGLAIFVALIIGLAAAANLDTVLLWLNRVPYGSSAGAVTDPVFGRDISFYLFELPFLRAAQAIFNALVIGSLAIVLVRYLAGASRGGAVMTTPVRAHVAVLAGLFLLSVAAGYQLDKLELVYSNRGIATGVSYTDANAQFFAYDLLTVISGLTAAFVVGGAVTR